MDNKISTNLDTGLLKVIAFLTMLIDHVGYMFFPNEAIWRIIGRISFPLFAYCLVIGFLKTKNLRKYFLRLGIFAAVSQAPYVFCFYPDAPTLHLNIGFTLLLGLWALYALQRKKFFQFAGAVLLSLFPAVEYGIYGVLLIAAMGFFIDGKRSFFGICIGIYLASPFFGVFSDIAPAVQGFAAFAVVPLVIKTNSKIKIPRWLNYGFYPAHLCVLALLGYLIK